MTPDPAPSALLRRSDVVLLPDPRRVVAQLFLPGQELAAPGTSRASSVVARCLAMTAAETREALDRLGSFAGRHRDFTQVLERHFAAVEHRVEHAAALSTDQRHLIGAYFTQEYALEAAALFNPSLVAHPVPDPDPDNLRFVMSARAVGEGHVSSIVFGSGTLHSGGRPSVTLDPRSPLATRGSQLAGLLDRESLRTQVAAAGADLGSLGVVLDALPERFSGDVLDSAVNGLRDQQLTRIHAERTIGHLRSAAGRSYQIEFAADTDLSERTLLPAAPSESHGLEDARFVEFTDAGDSTYLATYTAFDGSRIVPARMQTDDFRTFRASPFTGRAASNKGMALFPRPVGGQHLALSRWDRENNFIASSPDGHDWPDAVEVQAPRRPWEIIQLGNCGSPIETDEGWLVLTHGVGAMREYAIGALLLDLDDPTRVRGRLNQPLLRPDADERDGYVPNVVYSCGGLVHGQTLLLPYGCSDSSIRLAFVDLPQLLSRLLAKEGTTT